MAFTAADEYVVRTVFFEYQEGYSDITDIPMANWHKERANAVLPGVAAAVCDALRTTIAADEEVRELVPMPSYHGNDEVMHARLDLVVCTERQVYLVWAGSDTGVQVQPYPFGAVEADARFVQSHSELEQKHGRPVLVFSREFGTETRMKRILATPPTQRNPKLPTEAPRPPAAWHPDPSGRHQVRWWDGTAWTSTAADNGVTVEDPL